MHGPNDMEWYERVSDGGASNAVATIGPVPDAETVRVLDVARQIALPNATMSLSTG